MGILIKDSSSYLPENKVDNHYFETIMDTSDEWIKKRTGISSRHLGNKSVQEMAIQCAKELLSGHSELTISLVIVATFTDQHRMPSVSSAVANACHLLGKVRAFDINIACSGFAAALDMADKFLDEGEHAIVIGSEQISSFLDMTDRSTAILFGDGAGAVLVQKNGMTTFTDYGLVADSNHLSLNNNHKIRMNGQEVFVFAVTVLKETIRKAIESIGEPDYIICHQANERILDHVSHALKINPTKFYKTVSMLGNTSAASIPLCIDFMKKDNLFRQKVSVLTCGFGAGLTYYSKYVEIKINDEF